MFICEIWLCNLYFPQFRKSDMSKCFRGSLQLRDNESRLYIEDIYSFEVNIKFISSNVLKISVISRMRSTSEIADIFNT